jgi:hypothetical protein
MVMGMQGWGRTAAKSGKRSRLRAGAASVGTATARRAARHQSASPGRRSEWSSFVTRCLRSWFAARASATDFLANWTPLGLPALAPLTPARPHHSRRKPSNPMRRSSRRAAHHPNARAVAPAWIGPLAAAGSAEALRARYPLVSALLVELSLKQNRPAAVSPTLHRA